MKTMFLHDAKKGLCGNVHIEWLYKFYVWAQTGSAVGHAVVLQNNSAALDKTDGEPSDRHSRTRADQARRTGLQERRGRPSQSRKAGRQRATEDAWKSMKSRVDATSQGFQNASDQFARALGYSGEEGERL